ncbi:type ISP restriction/modification enzyme [Achromobacter xylosoxidans]
MLLAYYIAAVNIEAVYHGIVGGNYQPFEGICLADTFQMHETEDMVDALLVQNSARRKRQKKLDIRVIMANPPYSSGDKNDNNNKNIDYPDLDGRIAQTYVRKSSRPAGKSKIYDSYIRAIRWASDRIGNSGVIGFVTNAGFLDANTTDGMRRCLAEEFSNIYIFHLRGNQRTSGELSRQEGGKIFGSGSRAPIAISIFVKNPNADSYGNVYFHDIGDYLSREAKLEKIASYGSIGSIPEDQWKKLVLDRYGDWFGQRDSSFEDFIVIGKKQADAGLAVFATYSMGVKSNRDDWVYSSSKKRLEENLTNMIAFYNKEVARYQAAPDGVDAEDFIDRDKTKIKWTSDLLADLGKGRRHDFYSRDLVVSMYRPFTKQWLYSNKTWNWSRHLMAGYFPPEGGSNLAICVTGRGSTKDFSAFMVNTIPDLEVISKGQCLPYYLYEKEGDPSRKEWELPQTSLLEDSTASADNSSHRREAITDEGLRYFQSAYPGENINKEDVFYYVYGLLHSVDYRERYADSLSKELPRIPCVKNVTDFWAFSKAGRKLADLHINYETVEMYPLQVEGRSVLLGDADYRVEKMRYGKNGKDKDVTTLIYNDKITLKAIPAEAYEYVINGKPALDWIVERQCVRLDKDSGIVNDANDYAIETMNNPRYPLELFQRVVTVSLETMKIVKSLPYLEIQQPGPTVEQLIGAKADPDALTA